MSFDCMVFLLNEVICYVPLGFPISGFQVDAVDQVVLNLQDELQQTWKPGDHIVISSTDYSMHQAEEFTLLPCPHCTSRQVRIQGEREDLFVFFGLQTEIGRACVFFFVLCSSAPNL